MDEKKSSIGSIIGTIIIIALIILGGLYFWGKRIEESKNAQVMTTETTQPLAPERSEASVIKTLSTTSDDTASIEADLKATNVTGLDAEIK